MKKISCLLLSLLMIFSVSACGDDSNQVKGSIDDLTVWTVDANEKILNDKPELYGDIMGKCAVSVMVAKNEKEAGRVVLTAKEDVTAYDIIVDDLKAADGSVFKKENVSLFNEKYFPVNSVGKDFYQVVGEYPDALLPFETAKKHGENKVKKNTNQGVYVLFDIPADQKAGVYNGNLQIEVDDKAKTVPVTLKIYDTIVSEKVHSKSAFSINWMLYRGEIDTSDNMRNTYADFLAEYLVSGYDIMKKHYHTDGEIDYFVDSIAKLAANPKIASLKVPTRHVRRNMTVDGVSYNGKMVVDVDLLADYIVRIAERSFEDGIDILEKCFIYDIDEPELYPTLWSDENIMVYCHSFKLAKEKASDILNTNRTAYDIDDELFDKVAASAANMPNIITANSKKGVMSDSVYCPYFSKFDNVSDLEDYRAISYNQELWWYGCNVPSSPFPTYHIDDTLLSARLESWMRYDYDVIGNLYWAVDAMSWNGDYTSDYYRLTGSDLEAGEGLLLYPGKPYGLDKPLASLRLEAVRNGNEEYELLRSLELKYNEIAREGTPCTSKSIRDMLTESLYNGSRVNTTNEFMLSSRKGLYELSEMANGKAGLLITDISVINGEYAFTVYAKDGYNPKNNGIELSSTQSGQGGKFYTFKVRPTAENTDLNLSVTVDGREQSFNWYLGSSSIVYGAEDLKDSIKKYKADITVTKVEAQDIIASEDINAENDGEYLKVKIASTSEAQDFVLGGEAVTGIGSKTKRVVIRIYNSSDTNQFFNLAYKYSKKNLYSVVMNRELTPGLNVIEFNNVFNENWNLLGTLESMRFIFSNKSDTGTAAPEINNIYLKDIVTYLL